MTNASARFCAALPVALSLCFGWSCASASDRAETAASVTIVRSAAVTITNTVVNRTVANNASLQTLLLTAAIAPAGVVFTASRTDRVAGGRGTGGGAAADIGGAGLPATEGGDVAGWLAFGGSLTGATIDGDAVSVSVGNVSGGSAPGSAGVPVVIAQYN